MGSFFFCGVRLRNLTPTLSEGEGGRHSPRFQPWVKIRPSTPSAGASTPQEGNLSRNIAHEFIRG
jgi:hypothetical protein